MLCEFVRIFYFSIMLSIFEDKIPLVFIELLKFRLYLALDGKEYILNAGESVVMPTRKQHSVHAIESFKMQLTVVFPLER